MNVDHLINFKIPNVTKNEVPERALSLMKENHIRTLPVVDSGVFTGLVTDEKILDLLQSPAKINEKKKAPLSPTIKSLIEKQTLHLTLKDNVYEAIRLFSHTENDILPVLDVDSRYLGCVVEKELMDMAGELLSVNENGSLIEITFSNLYYSLSEVIKIIEENDGRIMSLNSIPSAKGSLLHRVEIKLNVMDGSRIKALLQRAGYSVKILGFDDEHQEEELRERALELLRYFET
ncbi:MAG: CBS domain-containing protein [Bacteroidetes bacterium]|nr:CBS domain-containing protein [Bacteroidota bacterium]